MSLETLTFPSDSWASEEVDLVSLKVFLFYSWSFPDLLDRLLEEAMEVCDQRVTSTFSLVGI